MIKSVPSQDDIGSSAYFEGLSHTAKEMGLQESDMGGTQSQKDRKLEYLASQQTRASWRTYTPDKQYGVVIRLAHENKIEGTLTYGDDGRGEMYIDNFQVSEDLQGQGLGTRLLKNLTAEAKYYGAVRLNGHVTSESALRTRAKVFGKDNLHFYNHNTGQKLDLTYEQALKEKPDVNVVVDLEKVDTTDWERPVRNDAAEAA